VANNSFVSPDGARLVVADAQGQLLVQPALGGVSEKVAGAVPWEVVAGWSKDGAELYVVEQKPPAIARLNLKTGVRAPFHPLSRLDPAGAGRVLFARVTPDGRTYAWNYDISLHDLYLVEGVK
jgi:hypothetical protein